MRFPRWGGLARVVRPHSIRTRVAFVILAAMAVSAAAIFWVFGATVDASTHAEIERALQQQANAVARTIDSTGPRDAARSARQAQRFMGDVRMVVSVADEVVYYSGRETDVEARATGHSGDVAVLLERPDPQARAVEPWFFYTLVAGSLAFIVLVVWYLSGTVARRLRRSVREVAESAEAVTRGRFDVRAPEHDDELGRLAHAFNRMTARLEAADARQREFLADVAHELRTPLTTIRTNAELLVEHPEVADTDRREAIADIAAEAERMARLTDELLVLARTDAAEPAATTHRPLDLAALVKEVVARAARAAPDGRAVTLEADGAAVVRGDPDLLTRLLWILVDNALRHGAGPVSVTVTADPDAPVTLGVADRGPGIALADRDRLFERFARGDRARAPGGFGLGLPIARAIVEAHGGTIRIEDAPGGGALFVVELPAG